MNSSKTNSIFSVITSNKIIYILVGIVFLIVLIILGLIFLSGSKDENKIPETSKINSVNPSTLAENNSSKDQELVWQLGPNGYEARGTAPKCEEPLIIELPVDIEQVNSILYPGQTRGGNYKPHGGFRFDNNKTNEVDVIAPMDGYLVQGARYIAEGEIQYTFDIIHPCGIMYRLGHLRELTSKYQEISDKFPAATEDSRTTFVNPAVKVIKGEKIATQISILSNNNTFVDFGVYDLRSKNESSQDKAYADAHDYQAEHAICWLNNLGSLSSYVISLPPADPTSGKNSDYCEAL